MGIKVKVKLALKGQLEQIREKFLEGVAKDFGKEINREIEAGLSPVKGKGRLVQYSDSYKHQIQTAKPFSRLGKRIRPVNLHLTGDMLSSQKVSRVSGGLRVTYTDKKAKWHNTDGVGKRKVRRRMLPTEKGEEFSRTLTKSLVNRAKDIVKASL